MYGWLKEPAFREELRKGRDRITKAAFAVLRAAVSKAISTLIQMLNSDKEMVRLRAAEDILQFAQKAMELEDFERRITALELNRRTYEARDENSEA